MDKVVVRRLTLKTRNLLGLRYKYLIPPLYNENNWNQSSNRNVVIFIQKKFKLTITSMINVMFSINIKRSYQISFQKKKKKNVHIRWYVGVIESNIFFIRYEARLPSLFVFFFFFFFFFDFLRLLFLLLKSLSPCPYSKYHSFKAISNTRKTKFMVNNDIRFFLISFDSVKRELIYFIYLFCVNI